MTIKLGIERLAENPSLTQSWGKCALLCNQASVNRDFTPSWQILKDLLGDRLIAYFGPQHGFHATVQDNMIETDHCLGPYNLPIYSLYSETREPTEKMLDGIDTIVIDIQNVGCRVYTFKYTVSACLRAAVKYSKKVVVLDRPNPVGGMRAEGMVLDPNLHSFVGEFAIPMRHALTMGEAAKLFNEEIKAELDIVTLDAWDDSSDWSKLNRSWVLTSPNLPNFESVAVYPGSVLFEGTNISEGRGTCLPFQFIGAPFVKDSETLIKRIKDHDNSSSFYLRPTEFQPTSQKWQGQACRGFQIHVLEPDRFDSFQLGITILYSFLELYGDKVEFKQPPYEYDYHTLPLKLIAGQQDIVERLKDKVYDPADSYWKKGLESYKARAENIFLYDRHLLID